jgi:hypothetical protein
MLQCSGALAAGTRVLCDASMEAWRAQGAVSGLTARNDAHAQLMTGYVGKYESSQDNTKECTRAVVEQRRNTNFGGSSEGHFYVPWVMIALP